MIHASRYNVIVPCPDGGTILYNQVSGGLLVLDDARLAEYEVLAATDGTGPFFDLLRRGRFLVDADHDEREVLGDHWRRVTSSTRVKGLTLVPTDRCNLGCTYCYEEKHDWDLMSDEVVEKVKHFVTRLVDATPTDELRLTWFGGEPTLHMRCIEVLSRFLIDLCESRGIAYMTFLVTNGTTLTPHVLARLRACRVTRMQVTVDGLAEDHDRTRPYLRDVITPNPAQVAQRAKIGLTVLGNPPARKTSSFAVIMAHVREAREAGFDVQLRMNVDHANKEGVRALFRQLRDEDLLSRHASGGQISPYASPIFEGCGGCSPLSMSRAEYVAFEDELRAEGLARDMGRSRDLRFTGATCTANMDFDFIINQRGVLTKCWHHASDGRHAVGTVDDLHLAERGTRAVDPLAFNPLADDECRECQVLPLCMGGCKANNEFPARGYRGTKDGGCHTARFALPARVIEAYRSRRPAK